MTADEDTLSRVALSASAIARWRARAQAFLAEAAAHGVRGPSDVGDEMARIEADGSLTIYLPLPDGAEVSMRVEPDEWAWAGPPNH